MKKIFLSFFIAWLSVCAFAYNTGLNFHYDLSHNEIAVEDIQAYFWKYLEPVTGSSFVVIKNEVDTAGYQHIGFQQYVGNVFVNSAIVLVHAYQGKVLSINGYVFTQFQYEAQLNQPANISSVDAIRRVKKAAPAYGDGEMRFVSVLEKDQYKIHKVYRVLADDLTEYVYVDVYTGEVVMREPLVYSLDVDCTVSTYYAGEQTIQCMMKDGNYVLRDEDRKIVTLNATNAIFDYAADVNSMEGFNQKMQEYLARCADFTSATTDWGNAGGYKLCLDRVSILDIPGWTPQEGDSVPNVFLVVSNASDSILEITDCKEITSYPTTFTFNNNIELVDSMMFVYFYYCNDESEDSLLIALTLQKALSNNELIYEGEKLKATLIFNPVGNQPALDIHWGMEKTIDFYRDFFHRDGPDGKGSPVIQLYNPYVDDILFSSFPFNAAAMPHSIQPIMMAYGMGGKKADMFARPFVSLDVMAHEYTHHVTQNNGTGGLVYLDEAGALNESFSDLMAMAVLHYTHDSCDWTIGKSFLVDHNLRSLSDPWLSEEKPQPKYYMGQYWRPLGDYTPTGDHGGVHANSGVQNYWFYLLSEGGSGINEAGEAFNIPALGIDKAAKIAYINLLYYLNPSADYRQSRWGSIQAARELYGAGSAEEIAVTDAWAAVGVGKKYGEPSDEFDFTPGKYLVLNLCLESEEIFLMASNPQRPMGVRLQDFDAAVKHHVSDYEPEYVWEVADDGLGYTLKSGDMYLGYTSSNTVQMTAESKRLGIADYGYLYRLYFIQDNTRYYLVMNLEEGNEYFDFQQTENQYSRLLLVPLIDDTPDGCESTAQENVAVKILKDGHLLILRDGNAYTITGVKVE